MIPVFLPFQYEDDEGDKIIIATNNDLAAAVSYARSAGLKVKMSVLLVFSFDYFGFRGFVYDASN